jgi:endonuclease/exonuclease/phosphatase family metal-dependent hydrolase
MKETGKKVLKILRIVFIVFTAIIAFSMLLSAYAGRVNPVESARPALLGMCFPILLTLCGICLIAWLCLRQWKIAIIPLAGMILSAGPILIFSPVNFGFHTLSDDEKPRSFTLLQYNVMNFEDIDGLHCDDNRTMRYILNTDADMVNMQECSALEPFQQMPWLKPILDEVKKKYVYRDTLFHDNILMSKYPFTVVTDSILSHSYKNGNYAGCTIYKVNVRGKQLMIVNVHLQSIGLTEEDKKLYHELTELKKLDTYEDLHDVKATLLTKLSLAFKRRAGEARMIRDYIDTCKVKNLIISGDFNDTPDSYSYRVLRGNDMNDAYSDCAFGPTITYHANRFYFRIDQVMYRGDLKAVKIKREHGGASDHYPLLTTFVWNK